MKLGLVLEEPNHMFRYVEWEPVRILVTFTYRLTMAAVDQIRTSARDPAVLLASFPFIPIETPVDVQCLYWNHKGYVPLYDIT